MYEAGTTNPSGAPGFTPGFFVAGTTNPYRAPGFTPDF
jgi:hypothetical protein